MSKNIVIEASKELTVTTNRGYWGYQEISEIDQAKVTGAGDGDGDGCGCCGIGQGDGDGPDTGESAAGESNVGPEQLWPHYWEIPGTSV
jgi:hypothetical protein